MVYRVILLAGAARNAVLSRFIGSTGYSNGRRFLRSSVQSLANKVRFCTCYRHEYCLRTTGGLIMVCYTATGM
jgi:hypothetical protein